jgi:hypothetical protein
MGIQVHHMAIAALNDFGTHEQKQKYIPPLLKEIRSRLPEGRRDTCEPSQ